MNKGVFNEFNCLNECISQGGSTVYAKPLKKYTKVFTKWNYEGCMKGNKGDFLCYSENDINDIYVIKREVFEQTYEKIRE